LLSTSAAVRGAVPRDRDDGVTAMPRAFRLALSILLYLFHTLAYRWVLDLRDLLKRFWQAVKGLWVRLKNPDAGEHDADRDCSTVSAPAIHRPDPCIYSQQYLLSLGLSVTWDNPDIVIRRNGVIVAENDLLPDTDYEIEATVWNNSYEAPAVGLTVIFSYLSFGVGTVSTAIGSALVNLGVKGGPNHPAISRMPWRTPPVPGHYCLQVLLDWIDDANPRNNMGQNNLDVVAAHSPADFVFLLRNSLGRDSRFDFEADTYTIPQLPACPTEIAPEDRGTFPERLRRIRARHDRANFPVQPGWTVAIDPPQQSLAPGAEIEVHVRITPPDDFTGSKSFNVSATAEGRHAGGVSLIVNKS
jgi:hypothetical protein